MKISKLILKLQQLDQETDIFYYDEEDGNYELIIIENQIQNTDDEININYTIEKY